MSAIKEKNYFRLVSYGTGGSEGGRHRLVRVCGVHFFIKDNEKASKVKIGGRMGDDESRKDDVVDDDEKMPSFT